MQVARAATSFSSPVKSADAQSRLTSYVPLYLASTLGNTAFDIEELENIALARLQVLKAAERARSAASITTNVSKIEAIRSAVRAAERAHGLNIPPRTNQDRESRVMRDEASHFLVRLALCRSQEHRTWLLTTECDLFSTRLDGTGVEFALRSIAKANGPSVIPATSAEFEQFRVELDAVARGPNRQKGDAGTRYYKVPFEEVPSLVRHRRVFLHQGIAFVPERNVMDIVAAQFRSKLNGGLITANKAAAMVDRDRRIRPILESIRQHFAADGEKKSFNSGNESELISLNELNDSLPAMPLCMLNMMRKLREQHHLRHSARMQLGVFLKGCGLTMDESLRFWKSEFSKGDITGDKFEKNYAYNIRHHYGKEGKRRNLAPFACMRIINERPGPGEHHGCPYREFPETRLKQALRSAGVDPNAINVIAAKAAEGNFQVACGMCFAASQPGSHVISEMGLPEYIPNHPNEYFIEARRRRMTPIADATVIDEEIDDEELIYAAEAVESQTQTQSSNDKAEYQYDQIVMDYNVKMGKPENEKPTESPNGNSYIDADPSKNGDQDLDTQMPDAESNQESDVAAESEGTKSKSPNFNEDHEDELIEPKNASKRS